MTIEQRLTESRQLVGNHASLPLDRRRYVLDTLDAALNVIVTTGEVLAEREREIAELRNPVSDEKAETIAELTANNEALHTRIGIVTDQYDQALEHLAVAGRNNARLIIERSETHAERDKAIHNLCLERERLAGVRAALNDEMPPVRNARSKARGYTCSFCVWPKGTECGGAGGVCVGNT